MYFNSTKFYTFYFALWSFGILKVDLVLSYLILQGMIWYNRQ